MMPRSRWFRGILLFCALLVFNLSLTNATSALQLLRMTPEGDDVPPGHQLVLQFDRPVVPIGRMERRAEELPIIITPALACAWRWLNTSALACQLDEQTAMAPATRYTVTLQTGLTALDRTTIAAPVTRTFLTQRPHVLSIWFHTWKSPGLPEMRVVFDQPVTPESIERHLYIQTPDGQQVATAVRQAERTDGQEWGVQPVTDLQQDARMQLKIEPGIVSTQGPEPGIEQRTVVAFDTFPPFRFLGLRCTTNNQTATTIAPAQQVNDSQRCNPLEPIALLFSSPVLKETVKDRLQVTPELAGGRPDVDPWTHIWTSPSLSTPHERGRPYAVQLPGPYQAYTTYTLHTTHTTGQRLTDVFNRVLRHDLRMQFATDHRLPAYHLGHPIAVLEQDVETHVPLIVTNLDTLHLGYSSLTTAGRQPHQQRDVRLDKLEDIAYAIPLKIRDLLPAASGALQGHIKTTPAVPRRQPQWFFAQVTPFDVHVKLGHHNTLVWVTRFDTGAPVQGARVQVAIETFGTFEAQPHALATGETNAAGIAMMPGVATLDAKLEVLNNWHRFAPHLMVRVQREDDMAMIPLIHDFLVRAYGPNHSYMPLSLQSQYGHIRTWGTTAQGVYKAGDTVQYTFYVRDQDNQRFVPAPRTGYRLNIIDPTDRVVHTIPTLTLSEFGGSHGEFKVPEQGAVGWYRFEISLAPYSHNWEPLRVLISDFTPAPFRVTTELHGKQFAPNDTVIVTTQASLHAGGAYTGASMRLTAQVNSRPLLPHDPKAAGFWFDVLSQSGTETVFQTETEVDQTGSRETTFTIREAAALYGDLVVESAVRDDRGKYIANQATARYIGRDRYVGLRQTDWVLQAGKPAQLHVLVVNDQGAVVAGTPVHVTIEQLQLKAARVKGAGNAYLTHYVQEWFHLASCTLFSTSAPQACQFIPTAPGTYKMTASITDTQGRSQRSSLQRWALGAGEVLWQTTPDQALQIMPEKTTYAVGDTARYLVQNPYPGAHALITIERYGVQQSWLQHFDNGLEVIEFPITEEHLPGFYVSVVVMSPRVAKPLGEHQVDLGKPAFRLGYVRVPVRDMAKELLLTVQPRQPTYKPRQTATVDLHVQTRQGDQPPVELAVAVVDEAVFDLIQAGRDYFDPYKGFYSLDAPDVRNYNLLTRLIGQQKFEKKGANPGGDGAMPGPALRSVVKFVTYWQPSLKPDAAGQATIQFPLPDNLTGWRVLAMAVTPNDRMGLGEGRFTVNQPTEIRPALPNHVTAGDRFEARFTVMNRTDSPRRLTVKLHAAGPIAPSEAVMQSLLAVPYQRYLVSLPVQTLHPGQITLQAQAGDAQDADALQHPLTIRPRRALEAVATYGSSVQDSLTETVAFPADMRTDIGHISVVAAPSVIGGLDGAFTYMRDYPYTCWEQVLSKSVMASHYQNLKPYLPETLEWPESDTLPQQALRRAANYQAPNGGMTYYIPQESYVSPYLSAYTALAFNWLRASGHALPIQLENRLHDYLLQMLRRNVMPDFYTAGMSSTVRAVALAALAPHKKVNVQDIQRYRRHVPDMSLFGKAHYLMALQHVPGTDALQADVIRMIQAHANETSGRFIFSEVVDAAYERLLASPLRSNCAILSAFLTQTAHGDQTRGVPSKFMRTLTQSRQNRDHWENTQENMFCLQAMIDFSRMYEREAPSMTLHAYLDDTRMGEARFQNFHDEAVDLQRPLQVTDPGRTAVITLKREGTGRLYYATRLVYAPKALRTTPINAGISIHREYSVARHGTWTLLHQPMQITQGELVRVDLYVFLPAARHFVVVDDPVPGGLEPVHRDLATASTVDAGKADRPYAKEAFWFQHHDWFEFGSSRWHFYHQELRHHAVRFYSEYLPAGRYHLAYVAQAIAPGTFTVLPVHVEEMYQPETFGQGVAGDLSVIAAPNVAAKERPNR